MAYSGSKAIAGRGTLFSIGGLSSITGAQTYTLIGENMSASPTGGQWATEDTTNFQSGNSQEFLSTILDNGTINLQGNRVSSDVGQTELMAAYLTGLKYNFQLVLPLGVGQTTVGDTFVYSALVQSYEFNSEATKVIKFTCKLKISGEPQYTQGS